MFFHLICQVKNYCGITYFQKLVKRKVRLHSYTFGKFTHLVFTSEITCFNKIISKMLILWKI